MATSGALQIMLNDLEDHPPLLVLDTSTSSELGYSRYPISLFPDVEAFVYGNYEHVIDIDGVAVWRRTTDN